MGDFNISLTALLPGAGCVHVERLRASLQTIYDTLFAYMTTGVLSFLRLLYRKICATNTLRYLFTTTA